MDPIAIGIIVGVAVIAGVYFIFFSKDDEPTQTSGPGLVEPVKPPTTPNPNLAKAVSKPKLPSKTAMEKLTKAALVDLGLEHGVALDKVKTKAKMIADLRAGVKK